MSEARLDPRLTLALAAVDVDSFDLADLALEGRVLAERYARPTPMQSIVAAAGLRVSPDPAAEQVDQLLFGEQFDVLAMRDGFGFGQARRDGYVGWVPLETLSQAAAVPTHGVRGLRSFVFSAPSIKAPPIACLSMNALITVDAKEGAFARLAGGGWVAAKHLAVLGRFETDPAAVALRYLGTPYLWGGRDSVGLDCSGLVQQALYACGLYGPRDSDMQANLGSALDRGGDLARNDLVFWRGHVAMMLDARRLIHANAYHMAVAVEPLAEAVDRIRAAGGGEPTAFRRLPLRFHSAGDWDAAL